MKSSILSVVVIISHTVLFRIHPGPLSASDHVVLPVAVYNKLGHPKEVEANQVQESVHDSERTKTSRLASRIFLDKSMNGIVVSVPEPVPID